MLVDELAHENALVVKCSDISALLHDANICQCVHVEVTAAAKLNPKVEHFISIWKPASSLPAQSETKFSMLARLQAVDFKLDLT